jgi:dihydrofolate reductase
LLPADTALDDVAALRASDGGDIVMWGSPSLVRSLLSRGLVDQLNLMIEPIVLGGGKRIFPDDGNARPMQLVKSVTAGTGVQLCTYQLASDVES